LTAASAISGTHSFMVYGLEQDAADWGWDESSAGFSTAPGLVFDGNSQTLGLNNTFTTTSHPDNPDVLNLGQIDIGGAAAGETISLDNPNLAVFLNLAAYYQGSASQDFVTIILQQVASASTASFWSREGNAALAPRLVLDAVLHPPALEGDFNADGQVDTADYVVWRKNGGTPEQFDAWKANFGAVLGGSGSGSSPGSVPEPATSGLLLAAWIGLWGGRRPLRVSGLFLQE
jgi:hypothetical protein